MEELDKRKLERNSSTTPSKPRVTGSMAKSLPSRKCPKWAKDDNKVPPDQEQSGTIIFLIVIHYPLTPILFTKGPEDNEDTEVNSFSFE